MKRRQFIAGSLATVAGVVAVPTAVLAAGAPATTGTSPFTNIPVTGTFTNAAGTGTFAGTLDVTQFANQAGQLVALGTLSGTLTDALGTILGTVTNVPVTLPTMASGTCQILTLVLGPLYLNLLGLVVTLNQVVLNITAVEAPGNLLGNLLCDVAHLLDTNASTSAIAMLLNQILRVLS